MTLTMYLKNMACVQIKINIYFVHSCLWSSKHCNSICKSYGLMQLIELVSPLSTKYQQGTKLGFLFEIELEAGVSSGAEIIQVLLTQVIFGWTDDVLIISRAPFWDQYPPWDRPFAYWWRTPINNVRSVIDSFETGDRESPIIQYGTTQSIAMGSLKHLDIWFIIYNG